MSQTGQDFLDILLGVMSNKTVSDYYKRKKVEEPEDIPECIEIPAGETHQGHFLIPVGSIGGHTLWLGFASHQECVASGLAEGLHFVE